MAATQRDLALQMLAQLRLLDPSISAEVGTPERKIIDTVAAALYDNQIDLDALANALNVDAKYGASLDRFLNLFGFSRQKAVYASGFVTFSRVAPATVDIRVPANSIVVAHIPDPGTDLTQTRVPFYTMYDVTLPAGSTEVTAPVRSNLAGGIGNVAVNGITEIQGNTVYGVTSVTNPVATSGGKDSESDEEYKVRFKNTLFRNLAGTQDQYMALAVATAYTSKANVVGPQSYYREYIQVPSVADNASWDVNGDLVPEAGNGNAGEYTSALSTIPYAKFVYATQIPVYVSNGEAGLGSIFYRQDTDFTLNYLDVTARNRGDTYRQAFVNLGPTPALTGPTQYQTNVTFKNVYTGLNADVQAIRPADVVLLEYAYMSEASRNDFTLNITNAVDVFIDGGNEVLANTVLTRPTSSTAFVDNANSKYHYENYRRVGSPEKRPIIGNVFLPTYWQPTVDVPNEIIVGINTYNKGIHYWPVQDVSVQAGTIRSRNGIEWSTKVFGRQATDATNSGPGVYTGAIITDTTGDPVGGAAITINDYTYDKNIVDLQAALEGAKQVTTDVLAHKAKIRYFKLDVTVMYSPGVSVIDTNNIVYQAVDDYLRSAYFGSVIQLSDLLQVIHEQQGIDNVRWTSDTPNSPDLIRVFETDRDGAPLLGVTVDRIQPGNIAFPGALPTPIAARPEIQGIYLTGAPTGGTFTITGAVGTTAALAYNVSAAALQTALRTATGDASLTVTEDTRSTTGVRYPMRSFRVTWSTNAPQLVLTANGNLLTGGSYVFKNDFFIRDDELCRLPGSIYVPVSGTPDTVPGLIIRPRAQNTWVQTR